MKIDIWLKSKFDEKLKKFNQLKQLYTNLVRHKQNMYGNNIVHNHSCCIRNPYSISESLTKMVTKVEVTHTCLQIRFATYHHFLLACSFIRHCNFQY